MASRGASSRINSCNFVVSSMRHNRPKLLTNLTATLREPLPEDRAVPDVGELLDVLADGLEVRGREMVAADAGHLDELGGDPKYREMRDEANERLIGKYIAQRSVFIGAFGETAAAEVGFEPVVDRGPKRLELQVQRVKERLESPDFEMPPLKAGGISIDPAGFAQGFEPEYGRLVAANADVMRELRNAESALIAKHEAMAVYDLWFHWVAGAWESLLRLAGMSEEAQRVRPSLRRPGRRSEEAESDRQDSEDPADAPPEGTPSDEPEGTSSDEPESPPESESETTE